MIRLSLGLALVLAGCSSSGNQGTAEAGAGGGPAAGGAVPSTTSATGGTSTSSGGSNTGGTRSTGGAATGGSSGSGGVAVAPGAPGVILDTDMSSDVDDVGALALLHAFADNGEATILGVICSDSTATDSASVATADAIDTYYKRPDLPIGLWSQQTHLDSRYTSQIAAEFPHDLGDDRAAIPDAIDVYRKLLAAQPDNSVIIAVVGPMYTLKDLLNSAADANSPLTGHDLIQKKVARVVVMGGGYPEYHGEFNFYAAERGDQAVSAVVGKWPSPMVFDGLELGLYVMTGASLANTPATNPVRRAYELNQGGVGVPRSSFDPIAVLYAVRGAESNFTLVDTGHNYIWSDGYNKWEAPDADPAQAYLVNAGGDRWQSPGAAVETAMAAEMDALLEKAPGVSKPK